MLATLQRHVIEPLQAAIGCPLSAAHYHDLTDATALTTDRQGTDIIGQQLELEFCGGPTLCLSWYGVPGWQTYSLAVARTSFCTAAERFVPPGDCWPRYLGRVLTGFRIFGYPRAEVSRTNLGTGHQTTDVYCYEPHLLLLNFDGVWMGVANWHAEDDFIPRQPIGDDIWVLFDAGQISRAIAELGLEALPNEP
ncbi:hypothetical protein OV203_38470 [Nannocystis sp. ILAH1]|uniref:hypothetical protein n=1 Tax=Nannocystis sp. ILAH1 TaxID=2996789 RepID=UPI002270F5B6|nr:hypothetical protein [Nannocystis sp. ILAH1]MCY0993090.1 hypothetical protein [Nannocystis sp. ILAH1]